MKVIAHRGACGYFPENTMASFKAAVDMGAASVEFDVQQTRDGELVILHDTDLRRYDGSKAKVGELTCSELMKRDLGSWFSPRFRGARAPTLKEALDLLLRRRLELHVEVKQAETPYEGIEKRVLSALAAKPAGKTLCVVSSADHPTLHRFRALDKDLRLGYLAGRAPMEEALAEAASLSCESVHISGRVFSEAWARGVHAKGMKLFVYTINDPADARKLEERKADGVFSDFPDLLRPADRVGGSV